MLSALLSLTLCLASLPSLHRLTPQEPSAQQAPAPAPEEPPVQEPPVQEPPVQEPEPAPPEPGQGAVMTREDFINLEEDSGTTPLPPPRPPEPRAVKDLLVLGPVGVRQRSPLARDPFLTRVVRGELSTPHEGETLELPDGRTVAWRALHSEEGRFEDPALRRGWAHARVQSEQEEVLLLEARGHSRLIVDGAPRGGDIYSTGLVRTPFVARPEGTDLFFRGGRGELQATVLNPPAPIFLEDRDATLPDMVRGRLDLLKGSILLVNATNEVQPELFVTCTAEFFGDKQVYLSTIRVRELMPLEVKRVAVDLPFYFEFEDNADLREFTLMVSLHQWHAEERLQVAFSQVRFPIRVRHPDESYKTTYTSSVDDSAQYYAVRPAARPEGASALPGVVLSLHGAGVEALGQAESYAPKDWAHIVAPTNRRPYGFDWESWGRIDALEALGDSIQRLRPDPDRIHLTGHSMGGHGAWNLGATEPRLFAAVAPSAGWSDFWSYSRAWEPRPDDPVGALFARAANSSRTGLLLENLAPRGVYVLHGEADDNVPVEESRALRERLEQFHTDFAYHEEPGAGHWWGAQCVDWPPLFEFLESRFIPRDQAVLDVSFATVNPAVSSRLHWLTLEAQHHSLLVSRARAKLDPTRRRFTLTTENVSRLVIDLRELAAPLVPGGAAVFPEGQPFSLEIDGTLLEADWPPGAIGVRVVQSQPGGGWMIAPTVPVLWKSPERAGPFQDALRNHMVFVYATGGTPEENSWSIQRARLDLDEWNYRGNGRAELLSDEVFLAKSTSARGKLNIVIYGHADMNKAWSTIYIPCPIQVRRGSVQVGSRSIQRDDLAVLFAFPRMESSLAMAAVVCGTGPVGQRLSENLSYFRSGVGYPDWAVFAPEMLEQGSEGVLGAGFFGYDWSLYRGDSAWRAQD